MPRRQKRFDCFYCGCRSASALPADTRRWQCKKCEAVNHLDEFGEITDPPTTVSQTQSRFAHARPRSESPPGLIPKEESPFCQRCLQNQLIINDVLASYEAPDTRDWERQYKSYVKELQETYPPICDGCEDRIRTKMQKSDYFVSAENLGRSMSRNDSNESWLYRRGWQYDFLSLVLTLGKLMWWTSWIGQFLWHALNLVKGRPHPECRLDKVPSRSNIYDCVPRIFSLVPLTASCNDFFTSLAGWSLVLGLLSIWWNPMWVKKLKLIYGRPVNKMEYYELQLIFLFLRSVLWTLLTKPEVTGMETSPWKAAHALTMIMTVLSAVLPLRAIRWDSTPRIGRTYSPGSLLAQEPRKPRALTRPQQPNFGTQSQLNPASGRPNQMTQRFPIDRLAPAPQQHLPAQPNPPTPPPEEDEESMMDWQPSQPFNLPAVTSYRDSKQTPNRPLAQSSPFYGQLPPNVVSPAHALRNPPFQPAPMQRASAQQQNFFNRNNTNLPQSFGNRTVQNNVGSGTSSLASNNFSPPNFANPTFFPSNVNTNTGLEDLFAKATTLERTSEASDISEEYRKRRQRAAIRASKRRELIYRGILMAIGIGVLAFAVQMVYYDNIVWDTFCDWASEVRCRFGGDGCE